MKAVIFARVSSIMQEDNNSLDGQTNNMKTYCAKKNFEIIKEIKLVESSTRGEREQFYEMIDFIKKQKEQPIALICDAVDRLQRSFKEVPILEELRVIGKLSIHFLRENQVLDKKSNSAQLMAYQMFVLMATAFANSISDNVKRGFSEKRKNGESLSHVPVGYATKDGIVTVDPFKSILVKQLFEDYSTGLYSMTELAKTYTKKGLQTSRGNGISKSHVDRILCHPFYYGYIPDIDEDDNPILRPHKYEKFIDKTLFDKCQDVRAGRRHTKYKRTEKPFILKGLAKCHHCKCSYSPESHKNNRYIYIRPTKSKGECEFCKNLNENIILEQIEKKIDLLHIPTDILEELKNCIKSTIESQYEIQNKEIVNLKTEKTKIETFMSSATQKFTEDSITQKDYNQIMQKYRQRNIEIISKLDELNEVPNDFESQVMTVLNVASKAKEIFKSSEVDVKRQIVNLLFPNLEITGQEALIYWRKPLDVFAKKEGCLVWSG